MAQYLLGENTLIDLCFKGTAAQQWLTTVSSTQLHASVIALAAARETLGALSKSAPAVARNIKALREVVARLVADGMTVLPFDANCANEWVNWRWEPLKITRGMVIQDAPQDTRMVIATAATNALCLVEPVEDYHAALVLHGMTVYSL